MPGPSSTAGAGSSATKAPATLAFGVALGAALAITCDPGVVHADDAFAVRPHVEVAAARFLGGWQGKEIPWGGAFAAALEAGPSRRFGIEARLFGATFGGGSTSSETSDAALKPTQSASFLGAGLGFRSHPFAATGGAIDGLWFGGALGFVRTGDVGRVSVDLRIGWDFRGGEHVQLGPFLGFLQVVEPDARSLRPVDARALMLGFHLGFDEGALVLPPPPPPVVVKPAAVALTKATVECAAGQTLDPKRNSCVDPPPPPPPKLCADGSVEGDSGCPPLRPDEVQVVGDEIVLGDRIYFDFGLATVKPKSFAILSALAKVILAHPEYVVIRVQGHTDEIGTDQFNQKLSEERADAVVEKLVLLGVPKQRLEAQGFGKQKPRAAGGSEQARQENRRVEFLIERKMMVGKL